MPDLKIFQTIFVAAPRAIIGTLMLAMVTLNFANVIGRHLFGEAVFWAGEIMQLCMVWGVFIGAIAVTFLGRHLRMDLFSSSLKAPWKYLLNATTTIVFFLVLLQISRLSGEVVLIMKSLGKVSYAAKYPVWIQHSAVLVGVALMIAAAAIRVRSYLTGKFE